MIQIMYILVPSVLSSCTQSLLEFEMEGGGGGGGLRDPSYPT
jgi:hypothetical protein